MVREHTVCGEMSSDQDMLDVARRYAQTIYHPTSTCRMGIDKSAVVDPQLRVYSIQNLQSLMRRLCRLLFQATPMRLLS